MGGVILKDSFRRLKKWEIALAVSVAVALCWGLVFGETRCSAWWGTVYPVIGGAEAQGVPVSAGGGGDGVVIRLRVLEWLAALLQRFR